MSLVSTERVLVVPTEVFHRLGHFQGFTKEVDRYLQELLSPEHTSYRPRSEMEQDPSYKQLIPYIVFRYTDGDGQHQVFQYTRGTGQGEQRLHLKRSIGVGGHISSDDAGLLGQSGADTELDPYQEGLRRELAEEVRVSTTYRDRLVGLINDDESDVGRVHLGVVHVFDVDSPDVTPREEEIRDSGFRPVGELLETLDTFETWSQICLEALFRRE